MSIVSLDGVELYYEVHGSGPPVVFIHGASASHLTWWQQIAEMRRHFTCLIYDLRGFGRSQPTAPYDVGDGRLLYQDLRGVIDHAGLDQPVSIVAASLGTAPALHFAMEHPDRIDKLVMACGPGGVTTPVIEEGWKRRVSRLSARKEQIEKQGAKAFGRMDGKGPPWVQSPGELGRFSLIYSPHGPVGEAMHLDSPALGFLYAEIFALADGPETLDLFPCFRARPVTEAEAADAGTPVLVVGGSEDALFSPQELEDVARIFPNARANIFKGVGHAAYYERARRFNDLTIDFLLHGHRG